MRQRLTIFGGTYQREPHGNIPGGENHLGATEYIIEHEKSVRESGRRAPVVVLHPGANPDVHLQRFAQYGEGFDGEPMWKRVRYSWWRVAAFWLWPRDLWPKITEKFYDIRELGFRGLWVSREKVACWKAYYEIEQTFQSWGQALGLMPGLERGVPQKITKEMGLVIIAVFILMLAGITPHIMGRQDDEIIQNQILAGDRITHLIYAPVHMKLPKSEHKMHGGGGGGRPKVTEPAIQGNRMPKFRKEPNPVAPTPVVAVVQVPKLPFDVELKAPKDLNPPSPPDSRYGIKESKQVQIESPGPGTDGIGAGHNGGIGPGTGQGFGPGNGGGLGGGTMGGTGKPAVIEQLQIIKAVDVSFDGYQPLDVFVYVKVGADGKIDMNAPIRFERVADKALEQRVREVLPHWQFKPKKVDGVPSATNSVRIKIHFRIKEVRG